MLPIVSNRSVIRQVLGNFKQTCFWLNDRFAKKLGVWNTALLYLEGILRRRGSVKEIAQSLKSSPHLQKLAAIQSIDPSALNRRLDDLPTDVLKQTYLELMNHHMKQRGLPRSLKRLGPLAAVDSTTLTLGRKRGEWAYRQQGQNAVKMHICLDLADEWEGVPSRVVLSTATVADLDKEVTEALLQAGERTYLLDRGYLDYSQYIAWARGGTLFVARIKANSKVRVLEKRPVDASFVQRDAIVELTDPQTGDVERLRLVEYSYKDDKGRTKQIRVLTNRFDVCASDVAQMYRYRWKVELFFKFMKQRLTLSHMYSAKQSAVWNQIYLNLIAYLLLDMWRLHVAPASKRGEWISLLRAYWERPWLALLRELQKPKQKTSRGRRKKGGRPRKHPKRLSAQRIVYM